MNYLNRLVLYWEIDKSGAGLDSATAFYLLERKLLKQ
jgi:hypothetical protein